MSENKQLIWLLLVYALLQLGSLFSGSSILFLAYLIVYVMAIVSGSRIVYVFVMENEPFKKLIIPYLLFFVANLILFLIYIPTLLLNPEINWKLKGGYEEDPMILQAFIPPVLFVAALLILFLVAMGTRLVKKYK